MMPAGRAPVTLRDFLELGCESSSDGFRSYPRRLHSHEDAAACVDVLKAPAAARPHVVVVDAELSPNNSPSSWSPSGSFFLTKSPGALGARISTLSRTFSRRISFWRRREYDVFDDRDSCGFPSPLVSSCCSSASDQPSSEYAESETTDIVIEETSSSAAAAVFEEVSSSVADRDCRDVPDAAGDGHDVQALGDGDPAVGRRNVETMEDKQQLSPVSVLDFPLEDDDGDEEEQSDAGTCSPSFLQHHHSHHSCAAANLQRKKSDKEQMLHKVRRFDGPTTVAVADHLEARFTSSSESGEEYVVDDAHGRCAHLPSNSRITDDSGEAEKPSTAPRRDYEEHRSIDDERSQGQDEEEPDDDKHRLLARLLDAASAAAVDEVTEWLLLDFFAEGVGRLISSSVPGPVAGTAPDKPLHDDDINKATAAAALVDAAMDWLRDAGPNWGIGDVMFSGESALRDMERSRRWMCVRDEEERYVAAEVEALVMDGLVDELVIELAPLVLRRQSIMEPGTVSS